MAVGAITATEYAGFVERLNAAELAMAGGTEAATVAIAENTAAMAINGGVARELGVLTGEGLRGNWTRLEGSSITLANRMNLLQYAFSPVGLAALAATASIAGFAYEIFKGEQQSEEFNRALINTGGVLGVTEGQFNSIAYSMTGLDTSIGTARETLMKLAQSGRVSGDSLEAAGRAAVDFAALTGQSADQAVAAIVKLEENPVKALQNLNNQYHFLQAAQFEHVQKLIEEGHQTEAATEAVKLFGQEEEKRLKKAQEDVGLLTKMWRGLVNTMSEAGDAVQSIGRKETAESQYEYALLMKKQYESLGRRQMASGDVGEAEQDKNAAAMWGVAADKWHSVVMQQRSTVHGQQEKQTVEDDKINADTKKKHPGGGDKAETQSLQQELAIQESLDKVSYDNRAQYELTFWTKKIATLKAGSAEYAQAYAQIGRLTQQVETEKERAATQAAQVAQQAAQTEASISINAANNQLDIEREKIQTKLALGQSSDQQATAQLTAAYERQYQAELSALQRELVALAAKPKMVDQINKEIEKLQGQHNLQMLKLEDQAAKDNQKLWQQRLAPISQAFNQSINGMIQGTQTLQQSLARIGDSIVAKFVQMGINMVVNWAANELAKTTATTAGAAQRSIVEAGAAAESKAADAATGKSQITSAAATGAAKAYQAIVGIPYVGPVLAPIAAGVAFAGIEAFSGMISSAQGGWERVPIDGAMTELHKDEMVLPAHVANPIRDMAKNGGGQGGGGQVHIHANDARSFKDMLRRNPGALAGALKQANRMGHLSGAMR
ncbi:hypothetical protein RHOFW104T7_13170 [Rhodanobacter thiooxydans]|uniref:Bacteriophage tail tape measure N-terminal domain-containing protein n=2 Tax=Rhodanobacter thiooxydans TaxID=416169 RepID=A0A154QHB2_9GAMM|nr:hypothetical protein RHOFW104T7_13170 [Rhodanobacter thiooxydans]